MIDMREPQRGPRRVAKRWRDPFSPEPWATRVKHVAPGVVRDDAVIRRLQDALFEADPLADALVTWLQSGDAKEARHVFDRAVDHGIESIENPPDALARFFAHVDDVPAWLDRTRLVRAAKVAQRVGLGGDYVLSSFALMPGYLASGTAKVLVGTGALERLAYRRLAETSKFVVDVYASPGMARFSAGTKSAVRVRVMHALVRAKLLANGWDDAQWGVPINQLDMCGTNILFGANFTMGLRSLGFLLSKQEREDLMHLWRYVGRLMGVADDLVATNEREGRRLLRLVGSSQSGPDGDTRRLAEALLGATLERWKGRRFGETLGKLDVGFRAGLTRLAVGKEAGDALGLPDDGWKYAILGVFPAVRFFEVVRTVTPFGDRIATAIGRRLVQGYLSRALGGRDPTYVPHDVSAGKRDARGT